MAGSFRNPQTVNKHALYDVVSALQKSIRRGQLDDALYFAADMELSGYGAFCFHRLLIIASEDVGLAWPEGPAVIRALYDTWREPYYQKHSARRLFLAHAVALLCKAPKSRLVDDAMVAHWYMHAEYARDIPDYAYDRHTQKGRKMGRGVDYTHDEGYHLENAASIDNPYASEARAAETAGRKDPPLKEERE